MKAEIITIGTEILIGQTIDTNSAWLGEKLNEIGIQIERITSINDEEQTIIQALNEASLRADVIFTTGGLGPTNDDITKYTLTKYFDTELVENKSVLENVKKRLERRGIPIRKINENQALVPKNCIPIENKNGTAPGMWFEQKKKIYVSMPGVPYEMKGIMQNYVLSKLSQKINNQTNILHTTITVVNVPESILAAKLTEFEKNLPDFVSISYLPHKTLVRIRLSGKHPIKNILEETLKNQLFKLKDHLKNEIFFDGSLNISQIVAQLLQSKQQTISLAESCTGGAISKELTNISGISKVFIGSIIAYHNNIKRKIDVKEETIINFGAVSEETVIEMLKIREQFNTNISVAVSGIAGPNGGTEEKPVGTVYIAVTNGKIQHVKRYKFNGNRITIIKNATFFAFEMLRQLLMNEIE